MGVWHPRHRHDWTPNLPSLLALLSANPTIVFEVLRDVDSLAVEQGKALINRGIISIVLEENAPDILYIDATVTGGNHSARAVIEGGHSTFVKLEVDGTDVPLNNSSESSADDSADDSAVELTLQTVWKFATETPLDELTFILETRRLNKAAAEWALMDPYGHHVGRTLHSEATTPCYGR